MELFEICTGAIGESYVRSYCWAESEERAKALFAENFPNERLATIDRLFSSASPEFVSQLSDSGFSLASTS